MLSNQHLSLTRIFLHNWYQFSHQVIDVVDGLYLGGDNGTGKSSAMDALQVVMIADSHRIRFNVSAQDRSERNLDSYVRGKYGENGWLRPGNTIAYLALEFSTPNRDVVVTPGVCIEAGPAHPAAPERTFFILHEPLDPALFFLAGQPLTRRELRKTLRDRRGAKTYDHVGEYQDRLLAALGGLNERFFDLFVRAFRFMPISRISAFVEEFLLDAKPINLDKLREVQENLHELQRRAELATRQISSLETILGQQRDILRQRELKAAYELLVQLLKGEQACRQIKLLTSQIAERQIALAEAEATLEKLQILQDQTERERDEAKRQYFTLGASRMEQLQQIIHENTLEIQSIQARWLDLKRALQTELDALQPLLVEDSSVLTSEDRGRVNALTEAAGQLAPDTLTSIWPDVLERCAGTLKAAIIRAAADRGRAADQRQERDKRRQELQSEIDDLQKRGRIRYPLMVETLRRRLAAVIGSQPALLCESIEVIDPHWQDAVEAMLGERRLNLIVPSAQFELAMRELDRARAQHEVYGVGLIDLARAAEYARPAAEHSLANQVSTDQPGVRAYLDYVLGGIIACETVAELRRHRRAVTPEVVVYSEWAVRAIHPDRYSPGYIGQQAVQAQLLARQRELGGVLAELAEIDERLARLNQALQILGRHGWGEIQQIFNQPLDSRPLQAEIDRAQAEISQIESSSHVQALKANIARLGQTIRELQAEESQANQSIGSIRGAINSFQKDQGKAEQEMQMLATDNQRARENSPAAAADADKLLATRLAAEDLNDEVDKAGNKTKEFSTRAENLALSLSSLAATYNQAYNFAGRPDDPTDDRYRREYQHLVETDLPSFQKQIAVARLEADAELREHVLHTLREQIAGARRELLRINQALDDLPPFNTERYVFRCEPDPEVVDYYQLITADSQLLGTGPLLESVFFRDHQVAFDRFYEALTCKPTSEVEEREQQRLSDYRRYLQYDVEVQDQRTGQKSRLSRIINQTSGGETQTPFYIAIAASFVQLYRIQEHSGMPTIRLVVFDEVFSKMDERRVGATLDLFNSFGLQLVIAAPMDRCKLIVPKNCTNLILNRIGNHVDIETYHNYLARIARLEDSWPDRQGTATS